MRKNQKVLEPGFLTKLNIARLGESYELSAELSIAADATLGVVNDVQQAVHQKSPKIAQKMAEQLICSQPYICK